MSKQIPLTKGKFVLVDDCDYEWLSRVKWFAGNCDGHFYAIRSVGPRNHVKKVLMHRVIMNAPHGLEVDHIDGNGLNNTRANLRLCTSAQNKWNGRRKHNTSGFKGVSFHKLSNLWRARIRINHKEHSIGYFHSAEDAARAYDNAARANFGEFACLNFK